MFKKLWENKLKKSISLINFVYFFTIFIVFIYLLRIIIKSADATEQLVAIGFILVGAYLLLNKKKGKGK